MLSIKKIQDMRANKKQKGFSFMEILVALIMIVSLSVGAFFTYSEAQQTRKMAQMHNDMDAIITGVLVYESLNINSQLPEELSNLVAADEDAAALPAAQAVDGVDHGTFVTSTKYAGGNFVDPWGGNYAYDDEARTLTCTPLDTNKGQMDPVVRHF